MAKITEIDTESLSLVKRKLLTRLLSGPKQFPKDWVKSSELLELSNQKYFDRRLRELRDEHGIDVETIQIDGEHQWRIKSDDVSEGTKRQYLTNKQKVELFKSNNYKCAACGEVFDSGIRGLQADHKVPLSRGGSNSIENWQPLCNTCNVVKRRACQGCNYDCKECLWAYPNQLEQMVLIAISENLSEHLGLDKISPSEKSRRVKDYLESK